MKYWSSGEIESSIGNDFRIAMNIIEDKINSLLAKNDYCDYIDSLDVIYIITVAGGNDSLKFKSKTKELDVRVKVDYNLFLNATQLEQEKLLINGLIRVMEQVSNNRSIKDFRVRDFFNDLTQLT